MSLIINYDSMTLSDKEALDNALKFIYDTMDKTEINNEERKGLARANIVVSGGRGLQDPSGFKLLEEFADLLGAEVGASRVAVNEGWKEWTRLVGITGASVKADIYFACGISGSIQHQGGIIDAKYIIAINKDKYAPIFNICDFGIIGDLYEVIPFIMESIKKMQ